MAIQTVGKWDGVCWSIIHFIHTTVWTENMWYAFIW